MPRLRILAGPSTTNLKEIRANTGEGIDVSSHDFEGKVAVYIKGFADPSGAVQNSAYFEQEDRKDVTWSIQFQGRFLKAHSADDVLFGNVFDKPLPIPWGFSSILAFMHYVDPTLEQNLQSQSKPWALSPLISTMTHFMHSTVDSSDKAPEFPASKAMGDNTSTLPFQSGTRPEALPQDSASTAEARRAFFKTANHRRLVTFGPNDLITADFCYNYLLFSSTGVQLKIPGGFSLDMMKLWDGRPVNFVCCARNAQSESENGPPLGEVFFCVAIEVLQDGEEDNKEENVSEPAEVGGSSADDVD
ncbi:hypothetical protein BC835DRAFT_1265032 [Cytidiella melzeri]|nr:hypothetical protein BC835DRAFT_1265032 [Cytidiella melzeri]